MNARGFTLIEILVAVVIFALLGTAAYSTLTAAQDAQISLRTRGERFQDLSKAVTLLARDYRQLSLRRARDAYGERLPIVRARCDERECWIEFTRTGWRNPGQLPRATLEHVIYRLEDDKLNRYSTLALDQAQGDALIKRELLAGVKALRIEYLPPSRVSNAKDNFSGTGMTDLDWSKGEWPAGGRLNEDDSNRPPRALKLTFEIDGLGEVTRVLP